jgi:hypothetical protein
MVTSRRKANRSHADLYRMFKQAGLRDLHLLPDATVFSDPYGLVEGTLRRGAMMFMTEDEASEWNVAIERAAQDGSFYVTWPHHCAVGTKPSI